MQKVATSIGRAVVMRVCKAGTDGMYPAPMWTRGMTEATNSPLAGFVVGSLTGMAHGTLRGRAEVVNNASARPQELGNVERS